MNSLDQLRADALSIFTHALQSCDIPSAFERHLHFEGRTRMLRGSASIPFDQFKEILIVALGKAALPMTTALLDRIPPDLAIRGICSAPAVPERPDARIRYFAGGHPVPNAQSFAAARESLHLLHSAGKDTFVFFLISGGGSAMFELPRDANISLEDTVAFYAALVASGATIAEINTVRKYFSAVKGGRLAMAAPDASKLSLLLADVPLKDLSAVASSPTLPDRSTLQECREILEQFQLPDKFPKTIRTFFEQIVVDPLPSDLKILPDAPFDVLLSSEDLINAARTVAQSLGYHVVIDNTCDDWDYRDALAYLLKKLHELRRQFSRVCLLSGGEVTVKLHGTNGCGGRNQQFALATALALKKKDGSVAVLSAGSDGIDGNSSAAGAIVDSATAMQARTHGFDPQAVLDHFDSGTLFTALDDTVITGPTGNNLRDLRILLASQI